MKKKILNRNSGGDARERDHLSANSQFLARLAKRSSWEREIINRENEREYE